MLLPRMPAEASASGPLPEGSVAAMLISAMCLCQLMSMLGTFAFPALLPHFLDLWDISNTQAGWINGIYFAGYSVAVPLLTSLTDRTDARKIYAVSCGIGALSNLGFALLSQGFWSALFFRALCGLSLAGTFIPGLKALIDRLESRFLPRAVSFYTACFGLGMSLSFYFSGAVFARFGWPAVFFWAALGSVGALAISLSLLRPVPAGGDKGAPRLFEILDFRPVWKNRPARIYILAYVCHMWEMFAARSWMVAFLTFSLTLQEKQHPGFAPATVMAIAGIGGMIASILFGELAVRFQRRRVVAAIMAISGIFGMSIGFGASLPYPFLAGLCIFYTLFFQGDSAAIHAGVITAAVPERRGATMALQSLAGFIAASLGSIVAGMVLDASGGGLTPLSWGLTFGVMGLSGLMGTILLFNHTR